jgi:hypothetical protein
MPLGLDNLHVFHTRGAQFRRGVLSGAVRIGIVLGKRRDAGNPQQFFQLIEESALVRVNVLVNLLRHLKPSVSGSIV